MTVFSKIRYQWELIRGDGTDDDTYEIIDQSGSEEQTLLLKILCWCFTTIQMFDVKNILAGLKLVGRLGQMNHAEMTDL